MSGKNFLKKYRGDLFPGTPFSHRAMTEPNNNTPNEDTRIRREINSIIRKMADQKASRSDIESILIQKYPDRKVYIIQMIDQYFEKLNSKNKGDER